MTAPVALPVILRGKLADLARRIRLLRLLRGSSVLVLILAIAFAGLYLADLWLDLSDTVLGIALAAIVAVAALTAVLGIVLPLCRRLPVAALAALVEKHYPELAERLITSVEVAASPEPGHGSGALIALLLRETEERARPLDFRRCFSGRPATILAAIAGCVLLLALLPALVQAEDYADFGRRLLTAWSPPDRFALHITPGDQALAVGQPLTVSIRLERLDERAPWPTAIHLACADAEGNSRRLRMEAKGLDTFTYTFDRVAASFTYRALCGRAASADHRITAVEPVTLAAGSPTYSLTPPPYVNPTVHPPETHTFSDLSALQYSRVRLDFRFDRPAQSARVRVSAQAPAGKGWTLPARLSTDHQEGFLELPALDVGAYALTLHTEAEHGIAAELELARLRVWGDGPPEFAGLPRDQGPRSVGVLQHEWEAAGYDAPRPREAAPADVVKLPVLVADRVGVDRVEVEYRVNAGGSRFETIIEAKGARSASADYSFQLKGKVQEGDVLYYRLRAADNRRLPAGACLGPDGLPIPATALVPHVIYFPEKTGAQDRWHALQITSRAEPLHKQEVLAQRDDVNARIADVRKKLAAERDRLQKLRQTSKEQATLTPDQARELHAVRQEHTSAREALSAVAREAAATPALQALAERARDVDANELDRADEALRKAPSDRAEPRGQQLKKADEELGAALGKLDEIQGLNAQLAQDRLDQARMEQLAQQQAELAHKTAALAAKQDPKEQPKLAELRAEQDRIAADLKKLAEQSKLFQGALAADRARQARQMADQAEKVAQAQRDLTGAQEKARQKRNGAVLAEFARKQEKLADETADLSRQAQEAAPRTRPLQAEDARAAARALQHEQADEAMRLQSQAAGEMERLAGDLDRSADLDGDPRETVRQLARAQQKLIDRLDDEAAKVAVRSPQQLQQAVDEIRRGQEAIRQATAEVPAHKYAVPLRQEAVDRADRAAATLKQRDPLQAHEDMKQVRQALDRLADQMPSPEHRRQIAAVLKELAREQRELAKQATEQGDPQLTARQADLARRMERMPALPTTLAAHDKAIKKMAAAHKALEQAKAPKDATAALNQAADAAEELARRAAGEPAPGQKPATPEQQAARAKAAQARQLAQAQKDLREALRQAMSAPPSATEAARQQERQQDLERQAGDVAKGLDEMAKEAGASPEMKQAAAQGHEAQSAMQKAGTEGKQAQDKAAQAMENAAAGAKQAAEKMAGKEGGPSGSEAGQKAGEAVAEGRKQMTLAQGKLGQGEYESAQSVMQHAASSLKKAAGQAARQMAQQGGQPGRPAPDSKSSTGSGAVGGTAPDPRTLARDMTKHAGRPWGQLPGELQTRILQDVRGRYGEDYAVIVQRYFEEIADTRRKP